MGVAEYAAERNRSIQDSVQNALRMIMQVKQQSDENKWRREQFEYQKGQNEINQTQQNRALERQEARDAQLAAYQQSMAEGNARRLDLLENPKPKPISPEPSDVKKRWDEAKGMNLSPEEFKIYVYGSAGKPEKPDKPEKPSSLETRRTMFLQAAKDAGITDTTEINKMWLEYLKGGSKIDPLDQAAADLLSGKTTGAAKTKVDPQGNTRYLHKNGKWYLEPEK
jgi:hypothetical protein